MDWKDFELDYSFYILCMCTLTKRQGVKNKNSSNIRKLGMIKQIMMIYMPRNTQAKKSHPQPKIKDKKWLKVIVRKCPL